MQGSGRVVNSAVTVLCGVGRSQKCRQGDPSTYQALPPLNPAVEDPSEPQVCLDLRWVVWSGADLGLLCVT